MDTITVNVGEEVKAGEQIATMGSRGYSTGPHLHFEVWDADGDKLNPLPWLRDHGIQF
jgi:murein DD-endopeptidase MepM/ murein hydrolase activator NlpD